jgi:hypothetical protein
MAFTGPATSRLLLLTDAGHDAVHVIDVAGRLHVGYVAAPGTIAGLRGVATRGSLVAVSAWKSFWQGNHVVRVFEGSGAMWTFFPDETFFLEGVGGGDPFGISQSGNQPLFPVYKSTTLPVFSCFRCTPWGVRLGAPSCHAPRVRAAWSQSLKTKMILRDPILVRADLAPASDGP